MSAIITSDATSIISSGVIVERRSYLRHFYKHELRRNPNAGFPNPEKLLLNLLALQGTDERLWREHHSKRFEKLFRRLTKTGHCPRYALLKGVEWLRDKIAAMPDDQIPIIQEVVYQGLIAVCRLLERYETEPKCHEHRDQTIACTAFIYYTDFIFDVVRYGAANCDQKDATCFRDLFAKIGNNEIPIHDVRLKHPKGVVIA